MSNNPMIPFVPIPEPDPSGKQEAQRVDGAVDSDVHDADDGHADRLGVRPEPDDSAA